MKKEKLKVLSLVGKARSKLLQNKIDDNAYATYIKIVQVAYQQNWPVKIPLTYNRIMALTGIKEQDLLKHALQQLINYNLLEIERTDRNGHNYYKLIL